MPSPAAPESSPTARWATAWLTGLTLGVILLFAAWARWLWPMVPVADSDTWGYLHPAISKLTGHGFAHTYGRNFVYPGFVYLLLWTTGNFRAIPVAQHLLGLASGGLLWVCWRQWRATFENSRLPTWADALLGLGLVAFFEQSPSVMSFEHHIRPEAIFPFFALLDLSLLLAFQRAWYVERRPGRAAALAGAGLFVALLLYQLKPSFGFALAVAAAPVVAAGVAPWRQERRARWRLAGAAGAALAAAAALFFWPESRLSQGDGMSTVFLPETLLTVHADLIDAQMDEDLRNHAASPYPVEWLTGMHRALETELQHAALPASHPWPSLGFNPDFLMYSRGSFCFQLIAHLEAPELAAFCFHFYRRVWTHHPGRMLAKIGRQLGVFYSLHCPAFWPGRALTLRRFYDKTVTSFNYPNYQREMAAYPPARVYLDAARGLTRCEVVLPQSPLMIKTNVAASVGAFPLLLLFIAGLTVAGLARAGRIDAPAVARLLAPGWGLLLFYGFVFGNCLTISVVHSMDVDRYSTNLVVYSALAAVATLTWLTEFVLALRGPRDARPAAGIVPDAPAEIMRN